jgi:hypothetical protein
VDITNVVALGISILAGLYMLYCLFWPQNL